MLRRPELRRKLLHQLLLASAHQPTSQRGTLRGAPYHASRCPLNERTRRARRGETRQGPPEVGKGSPRLPADLPSATDCRTGSPKRVGLQYDRREPERGGDKGSFRTGHRPARKPPQAEQNDISSAKYHCPGEKHPAQKPGDDEQIFRGVTEKSDCIAYPEGSRGAASQRQRRNRYHHRSARLKLLHPANLISLGRYDNEKVLRSATPYVHASTAAASHRSPFHSGGIRWDDGQEIEADVCRCRLIRTGSSGYALHSYKGHCAPPEGKLCLSHQNREIGARSLSQST